MRQQINNQEQIRRGNASLSLIVALYATPSRVTHRPPHKEADI